MPFLLIAYDLRRSGHDYTPFYSEMISMGAQRLQASLWGVNTADSAITICEQLWNRLDAEKDRLLVAAVDISQPLKSENEITHVQPVFWRREWNLK